MKDKLITGGMVSICPDNPRKVCISAGTATLRGKVVKWDGMVVKNKLFYPRELSFLELKILFKD